MTELMDPYHACGVYVPTTTAGAEVVPTASAPGDEPNTSAAKARPPKRGKTRNCQWDDGWKKRSRGTEETLWPSFRKVQFVLGSSQTQSHSISLRYVHTRNLLARLQHEVYARQWSAAATVFALLLREANHCIAALTQFGIEILNAEPNARHADSNLPSHLGRTLALSPRAGAGSAGVGVAEP